MQIWSSIIREMTFMLHPKLLWLCHGTDDTHDDVIKWKHFPRYWPFVRGIHRSPVNSPHKGQWRGALMFSLIYARINDWVNNGEAGDLRRNRAHPWCRMTHMYIIKVSVGSDSLSPIQRQVLIWHDAAVFFSLFTVAYWPVSLSMTSIPFRKPIMSS